MSFTLSALDELLATARRGDAATVATAVAEQLRARPVRAGAVAGSRVLAAGPDASVQLLHWPPGRRTPIHDHIAWCVVAILNGTLHEHVYRLEGQHLTAVGPVERTPGSVRACAPPDDIHSVHNLGPTPAVSLHVYGADLRDGLGSTRRTYDLPVLT
jgi:predicted metal-dependent enzyme (double-stranded beta helix superfamily)